jgi:DNA-binding response OmpR family regulator
MENNGKKIILLVEDDNFVGRAYNDGLTKAGYHVVLVTDGKEATDTLQHLTPDIILLDLVMPIKNGFEVLSEVRANDTYNSIPIIVLSNLGQESDIEKAKKAGATDYLIKNKHSLKDVLQQINKYITSH